MTVFSVLKYPISIPPTDKELAALPPGLIKEFLGENKFPMGDGEGLSPGDVAHFIRFFYEHSAPTVRYQAIEMCHILRKMIQELDE